MSSSSESDFGRTMRGLAPGQEVFGRYTLERVLGRGGMGVVWLALDRDLEQRVALKFVPEEVAYDKRAVEELKRETVRGRELRHPNIVAIYDFVSGGSGGLSDRENLASSYRGRSTPDFRYNTYGFRCVVGR